MTEQSTGVIKYGDDKQLALEISMIKRGVPGGSRMSDDDAKALLIASKFSGLDPYNGEIYLIPGRGVMVASKVSSADAITAAAKRGNSLQVSYDTINDQMPLFAEAGCVKGDVVVRCNIIDMKLRGNWFTEHNALVDSYKKMGYEPKELRALVTEIIGNRPPTIWALGIVRASEDFGGADGDKRYPRSDRARKRALKRALNAGGYFTTTMQRNFGGVPVIDESESASGEYVEGEVVSRGPVWTEPETKATGMTHEQRAAALGRDDNDSLIPDKPAAPTNGNGHSEPGTGVAAPDGHHMTVHELRTASIGALKAAGVDAKDAHAKLLEAGLSVPAADLHKAIEAAQRNTTRMSIDEINLMRSLLEDATIVADKELAS